MRGKHSTIIHKIFERNSSLHVKLQNTGKFWEEDWELDHNFMKFWDFSDLS